MADTFPREARYWHIFYRNKKNELSSPFFYLYFLLSSVLIFVLEISGVLGR